MPALNFQKQFADKVRSGEKHQTIRAYRKRPFVEGDKLYLFTCLRNKNCERLGEATALEVSHVFMQEDGLFILGSQPLSSVEVDKMARDDGFRSHADMLSYIKKTYGLPFQGQLIRW